VRSTYSTGRELQNQRNEVNSYEAEKEMNGLGNRRRERSFGEIIGGAAGRGIRGRVSSVRARLAWNRVSEH
jgi:hypothetical protein